ncbi:hypothetical protein NLX86_34140 [Streptomyces sp. A3M-1-3]|uniref:hypothetical protein n=1 Tax=Streptomyces sp. A3M-1-3 TaxID=2962044 RepID=UPI0020B6B243|nr:hypothetical protein [Streptomyces sp. A3M-1-3]MCP3822933.1 hypothetical protein [Streptomyces sp. A3M-1-3]
MTTAITTMKVPSDLRDRIGEVAAEIGGTMASALERLLDDHRRQRMLDQYTRLQADPEAWADYMAELGEWDHLAGDGLTSDSWETDK